jgi:hypothetical protein
MGPDGTSTPAGASGGSGSGEAIDLSTAVTAEAMLPILANADVQNKLMPHLPEGETLPRTVAELRNTVSTPQFQQVRGSEKFEHAKGVMGMEVEAILEGHWFRNTFRNVNTTFQQGRVEVLNDRDMLGR